MTPYSRAALRWVEPLLALGVGGAVALRFVEATPGADDDLGIVAPGTESFFDYPAPASYVRELTGEEIASLGAQFRQGAREVLLSHGFAESVAAAQGQLSVREMFEAAAGVLLSGQICRIRSIQPVEAGGAPFAWQLLCDAPLEAA